MQFVLHLDDVLIEELVDAGAAEQAVWAAFSAWGRGEAATTQRVRAATEAGMVSAMAAVVPPYCGGKLYATTGGRFTFINVLFSTDGRLLATLDGDVITRLRTPAATSLAIRHLAPPSTRVVAVIGTGLQAWGHLQMLATALPRLEEIRLGGRSPSRERLAERATAAGLPVTVVGDPDSAVQDAQLVVTVTSSRTPLFPASAIADDVLICAAGATKYDRAEIGADVVARCAAVVCDDVTGSKAECGDLIQAAARGRFDWDRAVELRDVAAGTVTIPRAGPGPVLFETQGVAIQDVAVAALAYERSQS
jgi:ornithine cyclodeaminase/alanine dehydrogenase-like protein (mu-crystallin family)